MTRIQSALTTVRASLQEGVQLVAVSKTKPVELLFEAYEAGQRDFGENKVQEAKSKWCQNVKDKYNINLHLIGSLQSNKAEIAFNFFDFIHTLDNEKLANIFSKLENRIV